MGDPLPPMPFDGGRQNRIQQADEPHLLALLFKLVGHFVGDHTTKRNPAKQIGSMGLAIPHRLHIARGQFLNGAALKRLFAGSLQELPFKRKKKAVDGYIGCQLVGQFLLPFGQLSNVVSHRSHGVGELGSGLLAKVFVHLLQFPLGAGS